MKNCFTLCASKKNMLMSLLKRHKIVGNKSWLWGIALIVGLNWMAQSWLVRIDLTDDQRYTMTPQTRQLLQSLDTPVWVDVYLEGELPADFRRLRNALRDLLEEFRLYAGGRIQYRFIDPLALPESALDSLMRRLVYYGIQPVNLYVREEGKRVEKLIFPAVLLRAHQRQAAVQLLQGDQRAALADPQQILNQSIENLEYELASAVYQLTLHQKKNIGYVYGHGELLPPQVDDLNQALSRFFDIYGVYLHEASIDSMDALIIAKPQQPFSEADKYRLDQYIMKGGKVLFFLDAVEIREDSINTPNGAVSLAYEHNLTDLLFRYGIRYNYQVIEDLNCGIMGLIIGEMAGKPQIEFLPWRYYPVFYNFFPSPITKNLNAILGRYVSTLDTVKAEGVRKIPLIATSPNTKLLSIPFIIHYNEARLDPDPKLFRDGVQTVAYLLEGRFRSLYANRILPDDARASTFLAESQKPTQLFVCADGDLIRNEVNWQKHEVLPLGYDRNAGVTFDNKRFATNLIHYMLDEQQLILAKNKEIRLRYLDKARLRHERTQWQMLNLLLPVGLTLLLGLVYHYIRRWRFAR